MPKQVPATPLIVDSLPRWETRERWAFAAICLIVVVVYGSLLTAPSLMWDDDLNIFENPYFLHGSWSTLLVKPYFGMYVPITSTLWAGLFKLGGSAVWPFRLLNLTLHIINIVLFAKLLGALFKRFQLRSTPALLVAVALFAIHPQQTAVVCWISGARDLAATMFAFCAIGVYFGEGRRRDLWSTLLFAAGLLCKPQIAGVPLAIVFFVWSFERARLRETLYTMGFWSLMVVASAFITSRAQAVMLTVQVPLTHRPLLALDALGFYLLKSAWPFPLAADYGRTPAAVWDNRWQIVPTIACLIAAVTLLRWAIRRNAVYKLGVVWVLVLLPILGIVTFPYQRVSTVADNYNYIALAVVAALVAIAIARSRWRASPLIWIAIAAVGIAGGAASLRRAQDRRGNDRFFTDMLAKNPTSFSARIDLSAMLCDRGDWRRGLSTIRVASAASPKDAAFFANETYCLFRGGRYADVFAQQERLLDPRLRDNLEINQNAAAILANSFAGAFIATDQPLQAFAYLCQAQALAPQDAGVAGNIKLVRATLRDRGREVACPGHVPWDVLEQIVQVLK